MIVLTLVANDTIRSIHHSLFRLFAAFYACFALVQLRGTVLAAEIAAAAVARHEGHLDSISDFALITLTGTAGFGHRDVSSTGRIVLGIPFPCVR